MAKGYPDYFGFSMFPFYGGTFRLYDLTVVANGATEDIGEIIGKGIVRSGGILVTVPDGSATMTLNLHSDGELVWSLPTTGFWSNNKSNFPDSPVVLAQESWELKKLFFNITKDISFNASFRLELINTAALGAMTATVNTLFHRIQT